MSTNLAPKDKNDIVDPPDPGYTRHIDDLIEDAEIEAEIEAENKTRVKNAKVVLISVLSIGLVIALFLFMNNDENPEGVAEQDIAGLLEDTDPLADEGLPPLDAETVIGSDEGFPDTQEGTSLLGRAENQINTIPSSKASNRKSATEIAENMVPDATQAFNKPKISDDIASAKSQASSFFDSVNKELRTITPPVNTPPVQIEKPKVSIPRNLKPVTIAPPVQKTIVKKPVSTERPNRVASIPKKTITKKVKPVTSSRRISTPPPSSSSIPGGYYVQIGAFSSQTNASKLVKQLRKKGVSAQINSKFRNSKTLYLVQTLRLKNKRQADATRSQLKRLGFKGAYITRTTG